MLCVLTHDEEQRTYIIRLLNNSTDSATFSLVLLPGESHNLGNVNGRMSLFIDKTPKARREDEKIYKAEETEAEAEAKEVAEEES